MVSFGDQVKWNQRMKVLGIKSAAVAQFQSWKVVENESEDKSTYGYTMKLAHNTVKSN